MAIKVKRIERAPELTFSERLYLPEIARGLWITGRHFFVNIFNLTAEFVFRRGRKKRSIMTVMYPEETIIPPAAYRGRPLLTVDENGLEKCVACGLCARACPPHCINITGGLRENGDRYPLEYILDGSRCIFCGRCEEVCPEEAIVMSSDWRGLVEYDRSKMIYDKETLMTPTGKLTARLEYIRSNAFADARYSRLQGKARDDE